MSLSLAGSIVGGLACVGAILAVFATPPFRRQTLSDRVAPYVRDLTDPTRSVGDEQSTSSSTLRRLVAPLLADAAGFVDKVLGSQVSIRRRLASVGSPVSLDQFRIEQVLWAAFGAGVGAGIAVILLVGGRGTPLLLIGVIVLGAIGGILTRDWWLSQTVSKYHSQLLAEFPVVAEMLALSVAAGEGLLDAIARVTRLTRGHLSDRLGAILADTRAGIPFQDALTRARDATVLEPLSRFLDGMAVAIDRGTPMAEVLHAQAADVRALGKRRLLEAGGKKEIVMMIPVVFLVLPVTILFAFFPGLVAITSVAQ